MKWHKATTDDTNHDGDNKQVEGLDFQQAVIGEYSYDGDGKRVKKYVPDTGEYTIFVYDAAGKLVAEYSTQVASQQDAKVAYLTNDHLGSPRINTDADGAITARHDYHPFGEEIATSQRTSGLGYVDDSVRKQFTGYERDNEINLDFAQTRCFQNGAGRFSSPDSFTNDTYVSNPQSWNLYAYVRNNPLNMSDPLGKKGTVKWWTDDDGVVHIKLKASFAIYGAAGQNISKSDLKTYKEALERGIREILTKQGALGNGQRFSMTTDISAKVFKSEAAAIGSRRDNIVELGYGSIESSSGDAAGVAFNVKGESFDRMAVSIAQDPANYEGLDDPIAGAESVFAHEFAAHLLLALHNKTNKESVFYGEGDVARYGRSVDQSDMKRLMFGYDDSSYTPPPPVLFQKEYVPQAPFPKLPSNGSEQRHANSRDNFSPGSVYRWVLSVQK